jgi:hypothetical protein
LNDVQYLGELFIVVQVCCNSGFVKARLFLFVIVVNYQGLYGSEAPEFLDVAVCLCGSELKHVGVGDSETFGFCSRVFYSELGESVCEVSWFRCWDIVPE